MSFDKAAAKAAGYTDEEINGYLASKSFDYKGAHEAGYTDEEIQDHLVSQHGPIASEVSNMELLKETLSGERLRKNTLKMAGNIPSSASNYLKSIYEAVRHPVETAKSLYDLASGVASLAIPGEQPSEKAVDNLVDFFKQRYGSVENAQKTLINDPIGFASDASLAFNVVGGAMQMGGKAVMYPSAIRAGEAVSKIGQAIDPISMAKTGVKAAADLIPDALDNKLYASALKMPTTIPQATREKRVLTGLEEGIVPNQKGYAKLADRIDETNKGIASMIEGAAKNGETVKTSEIVDKLDDLRSFYRNTIDPQPFLDEIDDFQKRIESTHGTDIPIDKAQEIKKNTYILLRKHYGEMKGLGIEAQKAVARGIKDEIVKAHPEIGLLNAKDSALIDLMDGIERSVARIENRDVIGIGSPANIGAGAVIDLTAGTGGAATATGFIASLLDRPVVKAKLAIAIDRARKIESKSKLSLPTQATFQAGRNNEIQRRPPSNFQ